MDDDEDEDGGEVEYFYDEGDDESEDEEDVGHQLFTLVGNVFRAQLHPMHRQRAGRRGGRRPGQENLEPVPSEAGRELMTMGEFGHVSFVTVIDL